MAVKVLAVGDRLVLSALIVEAVRQEVGDDVETTTLDLEWPIEPFGQVAEVEEAAGTEEQVNEAVGDAEVLVTQLAPITERVLEAAGALKLVVCTRGGLLDYEALCDALESGHLEAAALDVYDEEPPPEGSRLFKVPRLVLSPHIAGATKETAQRAARIAAEEVGRYARGEKLVNVANREAVGDLA